MARPPDRTVGLDLAQALPADQATDLAADLATDLATDLAADLAPDEVFALLDLTPVLLGIALTAHESAGAPVTLPQYRALHALDRWGPFSAGGLAQRLGVHTSSVTRVCDRLVRTGLVSRRVNPQSRREVVLEVTPAGRAVVTQVLEVRAREARRILRGVPGPARRQLVQLSALLLDADRCRPADAVGVG